jgi:hypothetical protein
VTPGSTLGSTTSWSVMPVPFIARLLLNRTTRPRPTRRRRSSARSSATATARVGSDGSGSNTTSPSCTSVNARTSAASSLSPPPHAPAARSRATTAARAAPGCPDASHNRSLPRARAQTSDGRRPGAQHALPEPVGGLPSFRGHRDHSRNVSATGRVAGRRQRPVSSTSSWWTVAPQGPPPLGPPRGPARGPRSSNTGREAATAPSPAASPPKPRSPRPPAARPSPRRWPPCTPRSLGSRRPRTATRSTARASRSSTAGRCGWCASYSPALRRPRHGAPAPADLGAGPAAGPVGHRCPGGDDPWVLCGPGAHRAVPVGAAPAGACARPAGPGDRSTAGPPARPVDGPSPTPARRNPHSLAARQAIRCKPAPPRCGHRQRQR